MTVLSFLSADIGSGDGSHVSFSLATKLQEIIDISREMSLHDVEVETDQHWVSLQEERTSLMEQVEALTKALSAASEAAHTAESEIERLQLVQKASEVDYEKQAVEMEANNETYVKNWFFLCCDLFFVHDTRDVISLQITCGDGVVQRS